MSRPQKATSHPYADSKAFTRLMLLLATLVHHPGVGSSETPQALEKHHNALLEVQQRLQEMAQQHGIDLDTCSVHTLRKDLQTLKKWGILNARMYRWGYYIGTGAMSETELQVALNALYSQAHYQQDPEVSRIYYTLNRRLKGADLTGALFYPIRTQINRVIVHTDPEEMMSKGQYRSTLFHELQMVENAIVKGQAIELFHHRNPYSTSQSRYIHAYPLQLIYSEIAWYLLYEDCNNGHLVIVRVDRLSDHCRVLESSGRETNAQWESLKTAHELIESGWGLYLGKPEEQQLERQKQIKFVHITVRFFAPALDFIIEGEKRHPSQTIREGAKENGKLTYVDYSVKLPPRSCNAFSQWVYRFMENAIILAPPDLAKSHKEKAQALADRYSSQFD